MYKVRVKKTPFSPVTTKQTFDQRIDAIVYAKIMRDLVPTSDVVIVDTEKKESISY